MAEKKPEEREGGKTNAEKREVFRLRAPDKVRGTNWREVFFNEIVAVRDRVAQVYRPMNAKDLERRGWTPVDGKEKESTPEELLKIFKKNFGAIIKEAKTLPKSEELDAAIAASEKAFADGETEKEMSEACTAMTAIMDKVKKEQAEGEKKDNEKKGAKKDKKKDKKKDDKE